MGQADEITSFLTKDQLEKFRKDGFLIVPNFLSEKDADSLRLSCHKLVEEMDPKDHARTVFSTKDHDQARSDYFLNSGDNISFFFEKEALDEDGNIKVPKQLSLNKMGHALHWLVPEFKKVSFSNKMKACARDLGFVKPAVVQSMYIFKQPGYGGEVTPHKDSTFLSTEPQSCVGFWFALEEVTLDNGCLWVNPGTHNTPPGRKFIRNPDKNGPLTIFTAPPDPDYPDGYVPAPVSKGSLVLIHGKVDHKSAQNTSPKSRHIYTFHVIEQHNTVWDPKNWLQPTARMPFTGLFDNNP